MSDDQPPRPPRHLVSVAIGPAPKPQEAARLELILAASQLGVAQLQLDITMARRGIAMANAGGTRLDIKADQTFTPMDAAMEDVAEAAFEYARAHGWTPPASPDFASAPASEFRTALDVISRELEGFAMFARVGMDPLQPDEPMPIAVLVQHSDKPGVDDAIRETARRWIAGEVDETQ